MLTLALLPVYYLAREGYGGEETYAGGMGEGCVTPGISRFALPRMARESGNVLGPTR